VTVAVAVAVAGTGTVTVTVAVAGTVAAGSPTIVPLVDNLRPEQEMPTVAPAQDPRLLP
jgi:hypothetical protein